MTDPRARTLARAGSPPWLRTAVRWFATLAWFTAFAGQFWRNLLGWWGFGIVAGAVIAGAVVLLVVVRPTWNWRLVPKTVLAFVGFAALSIAWSAYPWTTVLMVVILAGTTVAGIALGLCLTWAEFLRTLADALRWILVLSLLFELWVAIFAGGPVLPNFVDYGGADVPAAFYWSRDLLFAGGPIEGIVANRNLLGMVALLALVLFGIQARTMGYRRDRAIGWIVLAVVVLALTRSATVLLAAAVVAAALGFAVWARRRSPDGRLPVYLTAAGSLAAAVALVIAAWGPLLELLGRSDDATGRLDIWASVRGLIAERPVLGWGWTGYWAPWTPPYDGLAVRNGVEYLQAHDAWLDVWMQLGILGLVLFALLVLGVLLRSWFVAVDRPRVDFGTGTHFRASALMPLLLVAALVAQSIGESRILIEGGWMLLVAIAFLTKRHRFAGEPMP
ncbi:O-antigen ligase family protein [Agromyces sp. SYSU T00194]|uniref:O-antigen ligase family protein n=1 Tax=Agromyces chitinivorans TaxID=3158560 RepID=UPI003394F6A9